MSEHGEGREIPPIPFSRINSEGKLEYTEQVIEAFESMLKRYPESPSAGEITLSDSKRLFAVESKSRGQDKLWNRTYYSPRQLGNPDEPITFDPNLAISLFKGVWNSGIVAYYYPENTFNPPHKVRVGTKGAIEKADVELFLPDHLSVTWGIDGAVGKVALESAEYKNLGLMRRDDLNILYNKEADRVTVPMYDDPSSQLEASLDYNNNIVVRALGGAQTKGYIIRSEMTSEDHKEILDLMATQELLQNPGTAPVTEDIWKGLDILPTFGITRIPS